MSQLNCGIVGLPNVGKSTLFNALTKNQAESSNYPFCTIDPNTGIVNIPDQRLEELARISHSQKIIPATMQFIDIAGLVAGASQGEGLGNQFLANIREVHAIIHVVRCFEDAEITHVTGSVDPVRDVQTIELELILADIQTIEKIIQRLQKEVRKNPDKRGELDLLVRAQQHLDKNLPLRTLLCAEEELQDLNVYQFLTLKRVLYVGNVGEKETLSQKDSSNAMHLRALQEYAEKNESSVVPICAQLEMEIAQLSEEEEREMLKELGIREIALHQLIRRSFSLLNLMTFLTTGEMETRAWTISKGMNAPEAAGKIHSDFEKGFIRAEVISCEDFIACGGRNGARDRGKMRAEGKEYVVQDGDVILFLTN